MTRSFELYRLASSQGHDRATYKLGEFYLSGDEEIINSTGELDAEALNAEALRLYLLAVAQGYQNPLIADLYYCGERGILQDRAEAIRFYRLAVAQGYAAAQNNLRLLKEEV